MTKYPDLKDLIHGIDSQLEGIAISVDSSSVGSALEPMAKYILVEIGSRSLAIAIDSLAEVGAQPKVTFLPNLPEWILGIMNIRSEIISMVDFACFLNEERVQVRSEKKLIVLRNEKMKVGIGVDAIVGTVTKSLNDIQPAEVSSENSIGNILFTHNLLDDGTLYSLLDVPKFFTLRKLVNFSEESFDSNVL